MVAVPIQSAETVPARCATCHSESADDSLSFVPWGEGRATGRWLCFSCLLTLFRLDTRAEMEQRRASREHDSGYHRPRLVTGRLALG